MGRRLAAILGADIVGYSALMGQAEEETHRRVGAEIDRLYREIEKSDGRIFTFAGDGIMAEFPSAVAAVRCALRIQSDTGRRNAKLSPGRRIIFRIGISAGEIVLQQNRTGGNTVNIAARLESLAEPGGICLSSAVFEQVNESVSLPYEALGEQRLKNIRRPVTVYGLRASVCSSAISSPSLPRMSTMQVKEDDGDYRPSLAVLPFRTLHKDQVDSYFAEAMVDDIIRALGGLKDLLVISRSSTVGFARFPIDVRRIGYELDVRYVLHGSIRREREQLRIAVELCEAPTGSVIWADRFDGALAELFDLLDGISLRVAISIAPHLRQRELDRALRKRPENMTAYDLTLQALSLFHRMDRASLQKARTLLGQAVSHDPGYAQAFSQLALLHTRWVGQGWSEDERADEEKAVSAARSALERDPNDALALAIYGHMQSYLLKKHDVAMDYLERAVAAGPSCAWAWGYSSLTLGYVGNYAEAVSRAERAVRLSPLGPDACFLEHYLAQAYYLVGRFADAVAWGRMSASHSGADTSNLRCLIASLVAAGEADEACKVAGQLMRLVPTYGIASFLARTPLTGDARDLFAQRLRLAGVPG